MIRWRAATALAVLLLAAACEPVPDSNHDRSPAARDFPRAYRSVSGADVTGVSSEEARDDRREATTVMDLANINPGMTVADIGSGTGYYTVRLAGRVGSTGRVLAEDIDSEALRQLGSRVERERLDNVSIKLGTPEDPRLPANSFDRVFMVHMYHEVSEPYAFLWHLRPSLKAGGQVIVVDVDRPTDQHGINPRLLFCEFAQVGFRLVEFVRKPELAGYYAQFEPMGERPRPQEIVPCGQSGNPVTNGERNNKGAG
ncbi:MAG: methyltransferase domain-containing protein [Novosphingobium sp.]|nr:methyltransferase domain-containing protein [Novosphingobium sp.]